MKPPFYKALIVGALLFFAPFAALCILGAVALVEYELLIGWLILTLVCWLAARWSWKSVSRPSFTQETPPLEHTGIAPEAFWTDNDRAVWSEVRSFAAAFERGTRPLPEGPALLPAANELLELVAHAYHPDSRDPRLEVKVQDLLLVIEQASHELRTDAVEAIPFHHLVTLNDLFRFKQTKELAEQGAVLYRGIRVLTSPAAGMFGELKQLARKQGLDQLSAHGGRWLLARTIEALGKHLINLYSGNAIAALALDPAQQPRRAARPSELRIVLVGEKGSGKSSLAGALLQDEQVSKSASPETPDVELYELEVPDAGRTLLVDLPGYGDPATARESLRRHREALAKADLAILVVSALQAARHAERELLEEIEASSPSLPVLVAVSRVDLLRPMQHWSPPYDIAEPATHPPGEHRQKAEQIRQCALSVAEQLGVEDWRVVPVCVRDPNESYNVEALLLMMSSLVPQARTHLLGRMVREYREAHQWDALRRSLEKGGRLLVGKGLEAVLNRARQAADRLERSIR